MDYAHYDNDSLNEMLNIQFKNLKILESQAAKQGILVSLGLQNEINHAHDIINAIQEELFKRKNEVSFHDMEDYLIESTSIIERLSTETGKLTDNFLKYTLEVKSGANRDKIIRFIFMDIDAYARSLHSMNASLRDRIRDFSHLFSESVVYSKMNQSTKNSIVNGLIHGISVVKNAIAAVNDLVRSLENAARQYKNAGIDALSIDNGVDEVKRMTETMIVIERRFMTLLYKVQD
ncbi:hypothetical protein [Herpetosiphon llansteffanensis]|uniref:hypothetical protein n=1 Tax=Herpetosiphon llansteffanensis TaxID=2094568 RepID=UPI000D7B94AC|nr:hypothetical protein [Herpetosiphon llansteffanensis]